MNDGQYTNLRNYLEEIASLDKQILAEQKRTNELLAAQQKKWTELPVDADGYVIGKAKADDTGQQVFDVKVKNVPKEAIGPVTFETVEIVETEPPPDAHLAAVTQKVDLKPKAKTATKKGKSS